MLGFPRVGAGFPPCGRPLVGHSDDERFGNGETESDKSTISFVSYSSFISKGLESQRISVAKLVAPKSICHDFRFF